MKIYPFMNSVKVHSIDAGVENDILKTVPYSRNTNVIKAMKVFRRGLKKSKYSSENKACVNKKDMRQLCIVCAKYRHTSDSHFKHLEYIQKNGKSIDGEKPVLYGSDSEKEYMKIMTDKNWRFIISPDTNRYDLTLLGKTFMQRLEKNTGYKFSWLAANHYDTNQHHVHILINGIDKNGRVVQFPREKLRFLVIDLARDICTSMAGKRTQKDVQEKIINSLKKNYFTGTDKIIENLCVNNVLKDDFQSKSMGPYINQRLEYLMKLGYCSYDKASRSFVFREDWKDELKIMGKYNTYIDGLNYSGVTKEKYGLHRINKDGELEGEVIKKYIMQKDSNTFAILVKTKEGNVKYVPLSFYPKNLKVKDVVKISYADNKTSIRKKI